jgi:hypothetical protein
MRELLPLTPAQLRIAEDRLRNPAPGSRIEAAKKYGIDMGLIITQLRLTPAQRGEILESASEAVEQMRGIARRRR